MKPLLVDWVSKWIDEPCLERLIKRSWEVVLSPVAQDACPEVVEAVQVRVL